MTSYVLDNLARWNLQIALLVIVAAVLVRLLRIDAPLLRHHFWRGVLVASLVLPLVQPWNVQAIGAQADAIDILVSSPPTGLDGPGPSSVGSVLLARASGHVQATWTSYVAAILACGVVLRLSWLLMGISRLHRLRRAGALAHTSSGYEELVQLIEAGAEIRHVERLGQPVTFGVFRPAVLLPLSFAELPAGVQRAVLAHELWHVRRRDWMWVLVEELIRAVFWFNPAMWWAVARVQSSREEVVDELTVQLTNARKTYLEALLAFADKPTLFPATPFARRGHLFHRMLLISREAMMSSRRIVASSIAMGAVVFATGVYGSSAFPLKGVAASSGASAQQSPPRDRRPGEAGPESTRERELKDAITANPTNPDVYFQLAGLQAGRGATGEADSTIAALKRALPERVGLSAAIAQFYSRLGQFEQAVAALEDAAAADPSNAQGHQLVAVFYWEKAFKDQALSPSDKLRHIDAGLAATDRALGVKPDYVDALTYKNILLRMKANMETEPVSRQGLIAEADALRSRALELARELKNASGQDAMTFVPAPGQQPPPPPPPPPPVEFVDGQAPVRVGGNIKVPIKVRDVKPVYPPAALESRVQGVVIIEATIDTLGNVLSGRVLRGLPLLDQAALAAVSQWQFTPTLVDGSPVPVIMTVTVNFTLAPQ